VLPILLAEENCHHAFDLHQGPISKLDRTVNVAVELKECRSEACHMIGGARVEHPPSALCLLRIKELCEHFFFHQVERPCHRMRGLAPLSALLSISHGWHHLSTLPLSQWQTHRRWGSICDGLNSPPPASSRNKDGSSSWAVWASAFFAFERHSQAQWSDLPQL
jgi:hypothetical protein